MQNKSPLQSKTLWVNLIMAGAAFIPGASDFISQHPEMVMVAFSLINMGLRAITKSAISIQ